MKKTNKKIMVHTQLYKNIKSVLENARSNAYRAVNFAMVAAYWQVGQLIVEYEQKGKQRAAYGASLIRNLSERLTKEFGAGYSEQNLWNIRQFYNAFPILSTVWRELTWSHYKLLIRLDNEKARAFYAKETVECNWSVRILERQIRSHYFERLLSSQNKSTMIEKVDKKSIMAKPEDFIKDPYVLEFLKIKPDISLQERDIELALLNQIQKFLLELGKGFSFVARQQRISTETKEFYIDLVFYNYILRCFVLIDLKVGELMHQDIGQMDMYVRMYEDRVKNIGDNPTIGIILCAEKDETIVKYSVLKGSKKIFASKYKLVLPTEEELIRELERERQSLIEEPPKKKEKIGFLR